MESFRGSQPKREMSVGIMMVSQPIVLQIGSVRPGWVPDIPNMPVPMVRNMDLKTLLSSITDARSTAFSAKTGRIERGFGTERGSRRKILPEPLTNAPVAFATSVVIQLLSYLTPSKPLNEYWRGPLEESFGSVGKRMVP